MKAWTLAELDNIVSSMTPLVGLRLQEVQTTANDVILGFYSSQGILWLWIDLNAIRPSLLPWTQIPIRPEVQKTPLQLFLRAHFESRVLRSITRSQQHGRVVTLAFGKIEDKLELELRLFPHGRNFLAHADKKHIAWQKPQELTVANEVGEATGTPRPIDPLRSLEELRAQWLVERGGAKRSKGSQAPASPKVRLEKDLSKKQNALLKVREELQRKQDLPWRQIGDWLKQNQSVDVPREWEPFVDRRRKLAWNIEQCFTKAREGDAKIVGTERRLQILQNEIVVLQARLLSPESRKAMPESKPQPTLAKIEAQGRTLRLSDDMTVVMGKSAADNLKILRKARAWDLWFHMRDSPSSHGILFRNKNAKVGDAKIQEVLAWFVRNHLGVKAAQHIGEKFDVVIAECRHVHPIKGDKIGRVTFHDERHLIFQFSG